MASTLTKTTATGTGGPDTTSRAAQTGGAGATRSKAMGWALLTPVLLFFLVLNVIPTFWLIGLGFYKYSLGRGTPTWLGIDNFTEIINSPEMWGAFSRTLRFMLVAVGIEVLLGVALGFLFWGSIKMPGRRLALTLLFTPMVMAPVASGIFWQLIYEPTFGIINAIIQGLGGTKIDFLTNIDTALPAVLFVDIWMWTPFMIMMTLAALGSVPEAELEAAEVDRLSFWNKLRHVILPHGKFILMLGILLRTIDAFKTTDLIWTMTGGGPGNKTELIGVALYRQAFNSLDLGSASAVSFILLIIAIAFTSIYLYVLNLSRNR